MLVCIPSMWANLDKSVCQTHKYNCNMHSDGLKWNGKEHGSTSLSFKKEQHLNWYVVGKNNPILGVDGLKYSEESFRINIQMEPLLYYISVLFFLCCRGTIKKYKNKTIETVLWQVIVHTHVYMSYLHMNHILIGEEYWMHMREFWLHAFSWLI